MPPDSLHDRVLQFLSSIRALDEPGNRNMLLNNIPANLASSVPRPSGKDADLNGIVQYARDWGQLATGQWALAVVLNNAERFVKGTTAERTCIGLKDEFLHLVETGQVSDIVSGGSLRRGGKPRPELQIRDECRDRKAWFKDSPLNVMEVHLIIENIGNETAIDHYPHLKIEDEHDNVLFDNFSQLEVEGIPVNDIAGEIPTGGNVGWEVFNILASYSMRNEIELYGVDCLIGKKFTVTLHSEYKDPDRIHSYTTPIYQVKFSWYKESIFSRDLKITNHSATSVRMPKREGSDSPKSCDTEPKSSNILPAVAQNFRYLTPEEINEIVQAALQAGLGTNDARGSLLAVLNQGFASTLPDAHDRRFQLYADLNAMNLVERLTDGSVPLRDWLRQAGSLARQAVRREADVFTKYETQVDARAGG